MKLKFINDVKQRITENFQKIVTFISYIGRDNINENNLILLLSQTVVPGNYREKNLTATFKLLRNPFTKVNIFRYLKNRNRLI